MRILKGWTKDEQKELEKARQRFGNAVILISGIENDDDNCTYLTIKYLNESPYEDNQLIRDIADYYEGVAIFPRKKYFVHDKVTDRYIYFNKLEKSFYWSQLQARMPEIKTKEEWLNINPSYELRLESIED